MKSLGFPPFFGRFARAAPDNQPHLTDTPGSAVVADAEKRPEQM